MKQHRGKHNHDRRLGRTAILIGSALIMAGTGCEKTQPEATAGQPRANIKVETVHAQSFTDSLEIPGRVEADPAHLVHLYAPLSGRLMNLSIIPGQEVKQGQTVAMLQSGDVAQARADFQKAKIEADRADAALERGKTLAAHEVMSNADLQELNATDAAAHAEEERARQRVHELGFSETGTTDVTVINSPLTGTVLELGTAAGEMQRSLETSNGIATIANLDTVWVTGDLYERDLAKVHLHQPVDVILQAYPGELFHATVSNIGDLLDPATHSVKLRVTLANPGHKLKPGLFATLRLAQPPSSVILIPSAAVLHEGEAMEVNTETSRGEYAARQVKTGTVHGDQVEIVSGLHDGDRVVVQGAAFLRQPVGD